MSGMLTRMVMSVIAGGLAGGMCAASARADDGEHGPVRIALRPDPPFAGVFRVHRGALVRWRVSATAPNDGASLGIGGVSVDLVPAGTNPAAIALRPGNMPTDANGEPLLPNFDRPLGIANPGVGGAASGWGGTAVNGALLQLGGAQNMLGVGLGGSSPIAQGGAVVSGVGQNGEQLWVQGSLVAPSVDGIYSVSLANARASVITFVGPPGFASMAVPVEVELEPASLTFVVACIADFNGMGGVTLEDLFEYLAAWFAGGSSSDIDGMEGVTLQDLFDFLAAWFAGC